MQQFTVPQFLDIEDKIIGPITTRQFVILMAGFVIDVILYKLLDFMAFLVFGILIIGIAGVLAFLKINGRPFHFFILNVIQTMKRPKLRIWDSHDKDFEKDEDLHIDMGQAKIGADKSLAPANAKKFVSRSRLAELSLIVDTKGAYVGEEDSSRIDIKELDAALR